MPEIIKRSKAFPQHMSFSLQGDEVIHNLLPMLLPTRAIWRGGRAAFLRVKSHCIHRIDSEGRVFNIRISQLVSLLRITLWHNKMLHLQSKTKSYFHIGRMSDEEKGRWRKEVPLVRGDVYEGKANLFAASHVVCSRISFWSFPWSIYNRMCHLDRQPICLYRLIK